MIKLEMNDWLYNSGLLGLYRVLKYNNDYVKVEANYIEFKESSLENFGTKYFNYLIDKYKNHMPYTKLVKKLEYIVNTFDESKIEEYNKIIDDLKKEGGVLRKATFLKIKEMLKDGYIFTELLKSFKKFTKKNKDDVLQTIRDMLNYLKIENNKRTLLEKGINDNIISKFWFNVCFNYKQNKNKYEFESEYDKYFTSSAINYINIDNREDYEYTCSICENTMINKEKPNSFTLGFLNNIGVDVSRKTSHFWNLDAKAYGYICPLCNIVYSCIAIGFNVLKGDGLFINQNSSFEKMIKANNSSVNDSDTLEQLENKSYYAIIESIEQNKVEALDKEINNIQVVKLNNDKYQFNILSKEMLTIMSDNKDKLEKMINSYAKIENEFYNLHKEVLKRLYSNRNLFDLIYKLLKSNYSNSYMINNILLINNEIMNMKQGDVIMTNKQIKYVKNLGVELKAKYVSLNATNKIEAITHRLLNSIRTNDKNRFSETIIKAHMYVGSQISDVFVNALTDDESLKTLGYAFVLGLQGYNKKDEETQN